MALALVFVYIIIAIACATASRLLHRYVLKETEAYAYSLLTQVIASIVLLPFALSKFALPTEPRAWIAMAISAGLWSAIAVSAYIAYKKTEVSIKDPIGQSKVIWALLLGILFLGEQAGLFRILGTLTIFVGISILLWHPERRLGRLTDPGVRWTLGNALLAATVAVVDKYALQWFVPEVYMFFAYFFPIFILLLFLPGRSKHVRHLLQRHTLIAPLAIVLGVAEYFFVITAYTIADLTLVFPLLQLRTLTVALCGILILREREHLWQRILATVIIVAGAIITSL
jgi:drug/metabolite transporter (DMT)-like permease